MSLRSVEPCVWCGNDVMLPGSSWRTTDDGQVACSDKCETEWSTASSPASVHALLARVAELEALAQPATGGDEYRRGLEDAARQADKWEAQYPTDIWPDDGTSLDAKAAFHGRHVAKMIGEDIRALSPKDEP